MEEVKVNANKISGKRYGKRVGNLTKKMLDLGLYERQGKYD